MSRYQQVLNRYKSEQSSSQLSNVHMTSEGDNNSSHGHNSSRNIHASTAA